MIQTMKEDKKRSNNNVDNLIIAMFSCALAPMIARFLDLTCKNNVAWDTERIILLYLSSMAGYIVSDKLYRLIEHSNLYKKGFKVGDSDALKNIIWMIPVSIIINNYNNPFAIGIMIAIMLIAIAILCLDYNSVHINKYSLLLVGLFSVILIVINLLWPGHYTDRQWLGYYVRLLIAQAVVCVMWDLIAIVVHKIKDNVSS